MSRVRPERASRGGVRDCKMSNRQFWMVVAVIVLVLILVGWWQGVRFTRLAF
jgi:Tfp pilus assembly protein PilN